MNIRNLKLAVDNESVCTEVDIEQLDLSRETQTGEEGSIVLQYESLRECRFSDPSIILELSPCMRALLQATGLPPSSILTTYSSCKGK